jgi:hypothetical protein
MTLWFVDKIDFVPLSLALSIWWTFRELMDAKSAAERRWLMAAAFAVCLALDVATVVFRG